MRQSLVVRIVLSAFCLSAGPGPVVAQESFGTAGPFELSESVNVDQIDRPGRVQLERVDTDVAAGRWNDAMQTLGRVSDRYANQVILVEKGCYISVRDYVQARIAALPAEARARYRAQVDGLAQRWYHQGVANHDGVLLGRVVDELLCSSWGDDALMALGEIALERGWHAAARTAWERISRVAAVGLRIPGAPGAATRPPDTARRSDPVLVDFPDTRFNLANIRARLVLVSILAGELDRAHAELERFGRLHSAARGHLAGRQGNYASELASLLAAARSWPPARPQPDWTTFAGHPTRTAGRPPLRPIAGLAWKVSLAADASRAATGPMVDDAPCRQSSFHPLVVGDVVLVNDPTRILAFDLRTGRPAWGDRSAVLFAGEPPASDRPAGPRRHTLGAPHFTMTVWQGRLFARMGPPTTGGKLGATGPRQASYLVCLDLPAHGRLLWKVQPAAASWAFEGSPLVTDGNVYVAMRRSDVRPQAHVACLDARTGRLRWRRFVCAAETPAQGQADEITCNLLTLAEGTLYYNTNLGAVAALSPQNGAVRWLRLYPRDRRGDRRRLAPHFHRDLNPCIYHRGQLLVAPSDSRQVFALSAATGRRQWATALPADVTDLIGVRDGTLIASGQRLWWLDTRDGHVIWRWPESPRSGLQPCGRGTLAGKTVYWPLAHSIRMLPCRPTSETSAPREPIQLGPFGAQGGNLVTANGYLLVASSDTLYGLTCRAPSTSGPEHDVAQRPARAGL